jgi:hypothetical protein
MSLRLQRQYRCRNYPKSFDRIALRKFDIKIQPPISTLLCASHLPCVKLDEMVGADEELKAAKAAKAAIDALLKTTRKSEVLATLMKARGTAVLNLSSGGSLNEARSNVGIALSSVLRSRPTQEKIDKTKAAINDWIRELEACGGRI